MDSFVDRLPVDLDRIVGIHLLPSRRSICFFSVYLPTRSGCTDDFQNCLDQLDSLLSFYGLSSDIVLLGDFNADLGLVGPWGSTPINEQGWILQRYLQIGTSSLFICI